MKRWASFGLILLLARPMPAQSVTSFDRGTHAFRAVMNRCGLKPLETIQEALANPSQSLIVLVGRLNTFDEQLTDGGLRRYLRQGGAILFATDRPSHGEMWQQLEIAINGNIVMGPPGETQAIYRGELQQCPQLQQPMRLRLRSKLDLLGSMRVATNRPSFLNRRPMQGEDAPGMVPELQTPDDYARLNQARVVAELPTGSTLLGRQQFQVPEGRYLFAMADTLGRGRYAVLADHSLFLNMMMLQTDNDNVAFAVKLTNWLTDNGQRRQVLFVDDGIVRQDFSLNIDYVDPPLPHPDVLGPMVDQLVGSLERDNFFNQGIQRLVPPYRILRTALLALTAMAATGFVARLISRRHRQDRSEYRLPEQLDALAAPMPGEAAPPIQLETAGRELARGALEQWLGESVDVRQPIEVSGNAAWTKRVEAIWRMAAGKARGIRRPAELQRLARELAELQKVIDRGEIRISGASA